MSSIESGERQGVRERKEKFAARLVKSGATVEYAERKAAEIARRAERGGIQPNPRARKK